MKCTILLLVSLVTVHALIEFRNNKFYDGEAETIIKAVGYSPVPIGSDPTVQPPYGDYFTANYATIYKRDLAILRNLGINAIRLWGWGNGADHSDFLNTAYNGGVNPIYVIVQFWMGPGTYPDLSDQAVQLMVLNDFTLFVNTINANPAVLFYIVGSDLNAGWNYGGNLTALFLMLDKLADHVHTVNPNNLVTTALNDVDSGNTILTFDGLVSFDYWSINVYRGCTFGTMFNDYASVSKKPLFISEYGIDSFNDHNMALDQALQSNCIVSLSKEILSHNATALGGAVVEYVDEYWKGKNGAVDARHPGCPNYNAQLHSICGYPNDAFPDGYANQAWFGIVNASFAPRTVFTALQALWQSK
jgi:hypothetical protein